MGCDNLYSYFLLTRDVPDSKLSRQSSLVRKHHQGLGG